MSLNPADLGLSTHTRRRAALTDGDSMVASFYGMNVALPLAGSPNAFAIILAISVVLSLGGVLILRRMKMF